MRLGAAVNMRLCGSSMPRRAGISGGPIPITLCCSRRTPHAPICA
jgi:hypothetical protein